MRPDPTDGTASAKRSARRMGPIIAVGAVAAVVAGVVIATSGGGDDKKATTATTTATTAATSATTSAPSTTVAQATTTAAGPAKITFPLSFAAAKEQGIESQVDWGSRCDTKTGLHAVPDFFAQPCYAPFTGDNGGATAQGITADEITIVYYEGQANDPIIAYITDAVRVTDTAEQQFETMRNIMKYYEAYYELYGRKVKLETFVGTGNALDEVAARADAQVIAERFKPFVVFGGPDLTSAFADELAARKIMCIGCTPAQPNSFYVDRDPYVWALDGSNQHKQAHGVEFVKKQLLGKNAEFAGDKLKTTPRKFGQLYLQSSKASKDLADLFAKQMADIGAPLAEVVSYALDPATIQASASQAISKMKAAGVTTIVFTGDPVAPRDFTKEATAQEYFPEWFISGSALVDTNAFARTYDQQQWAHAFGVTQLAARTDPKAFGYRAIYEWFNGAPPPAPGSILLQQPQPALFFATVQAAGPNLTHETWKKALFAGTGTKAAISQPFLSWGSTRWPDPDYHGIDDATLIWWDPTTDGPDELQKTGKGMWRFVDGGKRYLPGEWPTTEKLFEPEGSIAIYTTPPPGEAPPTFPSPAK